jgi:hypothetical protein
MSIPVSENPAVGAYTLNPVNNFCGRWLSSSIIRDDLLYINGGIQKYNGTQQRTPVIGINNYLITIPLDRSWDWKNTIVINGEPKNESNPSTGTFPPNLIGGTMYHGPPNSSTIYAYGGSMYMGNQSAPQWWLPDASTYALWSYDVAANASGDYPWDQHDISQPWMPNRGLSAEAVDMGLGFYLNGQIDWGTSQLTSGIKNETLYTALDGMVIINLVDLTSVNISTPGLEGRGPRTGGRMEYIANVGTSGILVAIGGEVSESRKLIDPAKGSMLSLETVDIFDIESYLNDPSSNGTWYQQNTTGSIPESRVDFCLSTVAVPDNSSYHIYLYGGIDPVKNITYDDVYILSLPTFHWTQVFTNGATPRWGHDCHVAGNRQMLTLGGNITTLECDWEAKGIAVLDMTTITWGSVFQADAEPFKVPQRLLNTIGGTVDGGATAQDPVDGWTDPQLATVFNITRNWSTNTTATPTPTPEPKKTNVGAIAGGVVGGVVALALIAGLLFYFRRKHAVEHGPAELANNEAVVREELDDEKKKAEMPGINVEPAELPGPEAAELNAPREFAEAPPDTTTYAAELPGTNVVPWGKHGIPHVRTPGDDLPTPPEETAGLKPPIKSDEKS